MNDLDKLYKFLMGEGLLRHASYLGQIKKEASSDLIGNDMLSFATRYFVDGLGLYAGVEETSRSETQRIYKFNSPTKEQVQRVQRAVGDDIVEDFGKYMYETSKENSHHFRNPIFQGRTIYYTDIRGRVIGALFSELEGPGEDGKMVPIGKLQLYLYITPDKEVPNPDKEIPNPGRENFQLTPRHIQTLCQEGEVSISGETKRLSDLSEEEANSLCSKYKNTLG